MISTPMKSALVEPMQRDDRGTRLRQAERLRRTTGEINDLGSARRDPGH